MPPRFLLCLSVLAAGCVGQITGESQGTPGTGTNPKPGNTPPLMPTTPGGTGLLPPGTVVPQGSGMPAVTMPSGPNGAVQFTCAAGAGLSDGPMRRLTTLQYRNTLRDLLDRTMGGGGADLLKVDQVATALAQIPVDERLQVPQDPHGSFRRLDQSLDQTHMDGFYAAARAIGTALATPARMQALLGACATDADPKNDDGCVTAFVQKFGALALRRPLTAEDTAFYKQYYAASGIDPAGLADVVAGILLSPGFLYFIELPADNAPVGVSNLSAWETASRLSYHFWQTMPDAPLTEAARTGALLTDNGYKAEVERLFKDPRTRATLDEFYTDAFNLEEVPAMDVNVKDTVYKAFAGADLPGAGLRQAMIDDVVALLGHYTWQSPAGMEALLQSDLSFAQDPALARIYGVKPWTPGAPPEAMPAGQRPGLLTRAAFVSNGSINTRPVMKGVFIRKTLLCDDIPAPPANANVVPPAADAKQSTRQAVENITEAPGSSCAGCHKILINPLGFSTENFDALGRLRTEQRLFDEAGREVAKVPVDTSGVPQVVLGSTAPAAGAKELAGMILASGKAQACLARQYFRFAFARWEDAVDGCTLERLRKALADGGSLAGMFKEVALTPQFRQRNFQ